MIPLTKTERNPSIVVNKAKPEVKNDITEKTSQSQLEKSPQKNTSGGIFRLINSILSIIHTTLAVVTLVFTKNLNLTVPVFSYKIAINYTLNHDNNIHQIRSKFNGTSSRIEDVFQPKLMSLDSGLPIVWLTFSFFAITAFFHFGASILWHRYYLNSLKNKFNWLRWVEYSITAPLMWLVISQSFAFIEVTQLVLSTCMIAITMTTGVIVDYIARPDPCCDRWVLPLYTRLVFLLPGIVLYGCAALTLLVSLATNIDGELPTFVIPIVLVILALFECFAIVLITQQIRPPSKWIVGEYWYLALSLISKATLGITLIANVLIYEDYACIFDTNLC